MRPARKKPIVRIVCTTCGLRLTGEVRPDGRLYASRCPVGAVDSDRPWLCMSCAIRQGVIAEADA